MFYKAGVFRSTLLIQGKEKQFMECCEGIPKYCKDHLRGKEFARPRAMLMLFYVVMESDHYHLRIKPRAKRWLKLLREHPAQTVKDCEVLPYEKVWEMVVEGLR